MKALIIVLLLVLAFVVISLREQSKQNEKKRIALRNQFGKEPAKMTRPRSTRGKRSFLLQKRTSVYSLDDQTWSDLGLDEVLGRMDYTLTSAGEESLYRVLREPSFDKEELSYRQQVLQNLMSLVASKEGKETFLDYQMAFQAIGHTGNYTFAEYMEQLNSKKEESLFLYILLWCLYVPGIVTLFFQPLIGVCILFTGMFVNVAVHHKKKMGLQLYLVSFGYLLRMQHVVKALEKKDLSIFPKETTCLRRGLEVMKGFDVFSNLTMSMGSPLQSSNPIDVLLSYLHMMFHFDLMKFNQMLRIAKAGQKEIGSMVEAMGRIDVFLSMTCYLASIEQFCFSEEASVFRMEEGYHPLLENPVKNSIFLDGKKGILLTGSNASGKSTFLRTMAINALLAQSFGIALADCFSGPYVRLISSMSVKDDLKSGESYYVAEMIGLKRILDESANGQVLCFVDEILRGTNTTERIAASTEILQYLHKHGVMVFAATHDIELTRLLDRDYQNYHFAENYEKETGRISFSYLLQSGPSTSNNAILLLENYGYDADIIAAASSMVKNFNQTGKWMNIDED